MLGIGRFERFPGRLGPVVLLLLAACTGKGSHPSGAPGTAAATAAPAPRPPRPVGEPGVLAGRIVLRGIPPAATLLGMGTEPSCAKKHGAGGAKSEEYVVAKDGALAGVFVWVKDYDGPVPPVPTTPVILDQQGCTYVPHVFGVRAGQKIRLRNGDDAIHNVHAVSAGAGSFNQAMPPGMPEVERSFASPEVMVRFKCDVHPWMSAWCGVVGHPFFAVSGADGRFRIPDLPSGRWTVEAWHEAAGRVEKVVDVPAKGETDVSFELAVPTVAK